jgi:hypothetical protein
MPKPVRLILIVLTVLLIVSARCVSADEYVLGRVLSIDRNRGTVAVEVLDGADDRMKKDRGRARPPNNGSARVPQSSRVIIIDRHLLPDTITVNSTVRIHRAADTSRQQAIPPPSPGRKVPEPQDSYIKQHDDTTGVRHRIEKGSRPGGQQSPPKKSNGSHGKGGHGGGQHGR